MRIFWDACVLFSCHVLHLWCLDDLGATSVPTSLDSTPADLLGCEWPPVKQVGLWLLSFSLLVIERGTRCHVRLSGSLPAVLTLRVHPGTQRGACFRLAPVGSDPKSPCLSLSLSSNPAQGSEDMPGSPLASLHPIFPSLSQETRPYKWDILSHLGQDPGTPGPMPDSGFLSPREENEGRLSGETGPSLPVTPTCLCNPHGSTWAGLG